MMSNEVDLVKFVLRQMIGDNGGWSKDLLNSGQISWERFKQHIIYHELTPFAYLALKTYNSFLPPDLTEFLKKNYYYTLLRCQRLWQEFLRIAMAFEQARITLLPIKGLALLKDIYTDKPARPIVDIDLLVREDDLQRAEAIIYDLGYKKALCGLQEQYWRRRQSHIAFYKKENGKLSLIEVHWSLDFKRKNRDILPELWARIREVNVDGREIQLLSPEDTFFSLALHNRRYGKALCLKSIYDLILLLNKYADRFNWDYVLRQSKEYNICSTVFFALYQAKFVSGLNLAEDVWKGLNIHSWKKRIVQCFIEKNTFLPEQNSRGKSLYLKSHFLLYDSLWEPADYILNIPQEQFAKFYQLKPYDKRTVFLYRWRFFYIFFRSASNLLRPFYTEKERNMVECFRQGSRLKQLSVRRTEG